MRRRTRRTAGPRTPNRNVGRYFALTALMIIALALLVQSLRPADRAPLASNDQTLYVIRGEAHAACANAAQPVVLLTGEQASLSAGCTISTGAGTQTALVFDRAKLLVVLGPNAELQITAIERRTVGRALRLEAILARGKATCWLGGSALDSSSILWQIGPAEVFSDGGVFEAVSYDQSGARLTVHEGETRVALDSESGVIGSGQEAGLELGRALQPLATAQELPQRPALPAELTAAPTVAATQIGQSDTPTPAAGETLYTVRANDTLSDIAEAYGLTWQELWEANRDTVPDPQVLLAGQTLRIPTKIAE